MVGASRETRSLKPSGKANFLARSGVRLLMSTRSNLSPPAGIGDGGPRLDPVGESELDQRVRSQQAGKDAEPALVERARAGDQVAFGSLVARYGRPVLSLCFASTLDRGEAEDLSQEIFVSAWQNLSRFRGESAFSTWLFALARNACVSRARRWRSRPRPVAGEVVEPLASDQSGQPETVSAIFAAVGDLSMPLRQALLLRDLQGLSYEEIAALQAVPIGTVRSRIAAARTAVARAMDG